MSYTKLDEQSPVVRINNSISGVTYTLSLSSILRFKYNTQLNDAYHYSVDLGDLCFTISKEDYDAILRDWINFLKT